MFHSKYSYEYLSMFGVQIPVDAYPVFGLKRRSLLFVIDTITEMFMFDFSVIVFYRPLYTPVLAKRVAIKRNPL